jgi:hypothetical protein
MTLVTTIRAGVSGTLTQALDHGTVAFPFTWAADVNIASGIAAGQADVVFSDQRTLTASSNEDLDLAGSLSAPTGGTITIVKLKAVLLKAAAANTNNVVISRGASNGVPLFGGVSQSIAVLPGGFFLWVAPGAGITVTPATGDLINIANSGAGTSVTYDITFVGTSA